MKKLELLLRKNYLPKKIIIVLVTCFMSLLVGFSYLIFSHPIAPIVFPATVVALIILLFSLKKPLWIILFTLLVVLLPESLIPPEINSYINRISTIVAFFIWILNLLKNKSRIYLPVSSLLFISFLSWASITLLWADYFSEGSVVLGQYLFRLILFLLMLINEIKSTNEVNFLMFTLVISGSVLMVVSLLIIIFQNYTPGSRLQVLDVNENALGISLLITLPAIVWWAYFSKQEQTIIRKLILFLFLIVMVGLIGMTGSRGSAISLGITLLAFTKFKTTRPFGLLGILIVGILFLFIPFVFSTTISRFLLEQGETTLGGREFLWPAGVQLIKDNFLLGVGVGNGRYRLFPYLMNLGNRRSIPESSSLHNPILVIWADTGIIGLALYLSVLVTAVISFILQYFQHKVSESKILLPYFSLVASVFLGYMVSWIKGGGIETHFSYFLILLLLMIPSRIKSITY